jgi:hypothetical protein
MDLDVIDFGALAKGTVIPAAEVERCLGLSRTHKAYSMAALGLRGAIESHFAADGLTVTVIQRSDDLVILTDREAAEYNRERFRQHVRGLRRSHRRAAGVDPVPLTEQERRDHDRALEIQGRILLAVAAVRREITPRPHERRTPIMT